MINFSTRFQPLHTPCRPTSQPNVPVDSEKKEGPPTQLWRSAEDRKAYLDKRGQYADLIEKDIYTWGFRDGKLFKV